MGNMYQQHGPPPPQSMQPGAMNHPAMGFPNSQGSVFGQANLSMSQGYGSPSGMQNDNQWALYVIGGLLLWIAVLLLK
jgi:hypothetical protein